MSEIHDLLFEALAAEQRRRILFALVDHSSAVEPSVSVDEPPDATRCETTTPIERYHVHLPKLDDHGFIEWDRRTNTVRAGDRFADVRPILELCREREDDLSVE